MKKHTMILALVLAITNITFAQKGAFNKITPELQEELDKRPNSDEMFRIIIVMADEYDQNHMSRQIQFMEKSERRAFVIDELQRFAKASQYNLLQLLDEGAKLNSVKDVNPFWIFNGISCVTNREMIAVLSMRDDISLLESDEIRNMLPEHEHPAKIKEINRDMAWHVSQVHANGVWNYNGSSGYDGTGVIVAIIDTGVNYNHADLAGHMWDGGTQYPHHGYDFCSTLSSSDIATQDDDPMDEHGHGSHCAGITAGDGTSGTQTGIAPNATIMAVKVFTSSGSTTTECIINGIQFAANNGADILSLSLGGHGGGMASYRNIFVNLMNVGIIASIAAGNEGENYTSSNPDQDGDYYEVPDNVGHPGNCPPPWCHPDQTLTGGLSAVVTVGASNRNDRKTTFSSFGPCTWASGNSIGGFSDYPYTPGSTSEIGLIKPDIIAPGANITSCDYEDINGYVSMPGTSMATPLVAGVMALMLQADPSLTPAQIDEFLETTAFPVDYRITKNNYTGAGRVDALAAMDAILTQATKPTNVSFETCGGNVNLSWTASIAPAGYCIYRDNEQVGTTTETTYTDENVETGKHVYYVRANDNNGHQSVRSDALLCTIEPYATIPENLTITYNGTDAALVWDSSSVSNILSEDEIMYVDGYKNSFGGKANTTFHWGICFMPEDLREYQGMSIDQISVYFRAKDIEHTIRIYRGTTHGNTTGTAVLTQTYTPNTIGWKTVTLNNPYIMSDITQDLWITVSATSSDTYKYPISYNTYTGHNSNCFYLRTGSDTSNVIWRHYPDYNYLYACCIKAHLTRTTTYTPTYNVYLDDGSEANNISSTTYTDQPILHSGENTYHVIAKVGDNESGPSNDAKIVVIDNAQTKNSLAIDESLVYIIEHGGKLTVSDDLSNTDPNRLIIADGGQLIHNNEGVVATMQKYIAKHGTTVAEGGWNLIATPIVEGTTPSTENGILSSTVSNYDLYYYNESTNLWKNYKTASFDLVNGQGYLYANGDNDGTTLNFTGTLRACNADYTISNLSYTSTDTEFAGWNLVGNPFPAKAYLGNRDFYTMNSEGSEFLPAVRNDAIQPMEGVFVIANEDGEILTFSTEVPAKAPTLSLNLAQGRGIVDRAIIRFNEGRVLPKLQLYENSTKVYIPMNDADYAVVYSEGMGELPLNFKAAENGSYTLNVDMKDVDIDYLHLIDNKTGADIDLLSCPSYTFNAKTTDYESRFKLVFVANETDGPLAGSRNFAFFSNGNWIINNEGEATLQVIDINGRILSSEQINGSVSKAIHAVPGLYLIRVINGDEVKVQKILVK